MESRDKVIVRVSIIGILANLALVVFKAIIGLLANSIAIILDAINNLTDMLSSLVTIIGAKLAARKPDKHHPLGHGRIEYLSAMIVAAIILGAGVGAGYKSVESVLDPKTPEYTTIGLIIISVAVIVKVVLGLYYRKKGREVNSGALVASGTDALFDAIVSISVLGSAIIFIITGFNAEPYVGLLISVLIIKSGIEIMMETLNEILGQRFDRGLLKEIRNTICEEELVQGAYDLILHSYGPDRYMGSVHVEVPDTLTAEQIDELGRRIEESVYVKHGVILTGVGIYSVNTSDDTVVNLRKEITHLVNTHDDVIQMHGFHVDKTNNRAYLDLIMDYEYKDYEERFEAVCEEIRAAHPTYEWILTQDIDF
ncbi:MAG: cation diffusion facilitator family transporter [Eubacterium sp.]|nr:cation diffusion facilitator family transporter [Eubacterium sp.]